MNKILSFLLSLAFFHAYSQSLTLDQAIQIALKNNYGILIAKNDSAIARNNSSTASTSFLPSVDAYSSGSVARNNTNQSYSSGLEVNKKGVVSKSFNAGVELGLTLFDGFKMFASYEKELEEMSILNLKFQIENTISGIMNAYYSIFLQRQLQKALEHSISVYQVKIHLSQTRLDLGIGNKTDVLQAKIDMNAKRSALLKQKTLLEEFKINLNTLLGRSAETAFELTDSINFSYDPKFEDLKTSVQKQNLSLLLYEKNIRVGNLEVKEVRALRYPTLKVTGAYDLNRSSNTAGFLLSNQSQGLNAGFTATWNIFNGFNTSRLVKNAKIELQNDRLLYDETRQKVEASLISSWKVFKDAREILNLEEENFKLVKENLDISLERFRLGLSNSLELKEAQNSYEEAESRLVNARFDLKIKETELKKLNGELVK
jgi:outer membrane protein